LGSYFLFLLVFFVNCPDYNETTAGLPKLGVLAFDRFFYKVMAFPLNVSKTDGSLLYSKIRSSSLEDILNLFSSVL
jgi:hypothetical protein